MLLFKQNLTKMTQSLSLESLFQIYGIISMLVGFMGTMSFVEEWLYRTRFKIWPSILMLFFGGGTWILFSLGGFPFLTWDNFIPLISLLPFGLSFLWSIYIGIKGKYPVMLLHVWFLNLSFILFIILGIIQYQPWMILICVPIFIYGLTLYHNQQKGNYHNITPSS